MVSSQSSSRSASQRPASLGTSQARANCLPLVTEQQRQQSYPESSVLPLSLPEKGHGWKSAWSSVES